MLALEQLLLGLEQGRPAALGQQLLACVPDLRGVRPGVTLQDGDPLLAADAALLMALRFRGRLSGQQVDLVDLARERVQVLADARPDRLDAGQDGPVGRDRVGSARRRGQGRLGWRRRVHGPFGAQVPGRAGITGVHGQSSGIRIQPCFIAYTTAWVRSFTESLRRMELMWFLTVCSLMDRA